MVAAMTLTPAERATWAVLVGQLRLNPAPDGGWQPILEHAHTLAQHHTGPLDYRDRIVLMIGILCGTAATHRTHQETSP
jgi:hypothetical protein